MRKETGFTLIELLGVIVILSIVALMTIPIIVGIIEEVRINAYKRSLAGLFDATNLYIATTGFNVFPEEGIAITDLDVKMPNKENLSGKIIKNDQGNLELDNISNGIYCGSGTIDNISVIEGSCNQLDVTPPTLTISTSTVTSNSVIVVVSADDLESGIYGYQLSIDNGVTWTEVSITNVFEINDLTNNAEYILKAKAINNNGLVGESNSLIVTTTDIPVPSYSINPPGWTNNATVTINYPEREVGYVYEYSLDEGTSWKEVVSPAITKEITFNSNGIVIARISDGTNEISGASYSVMNIDAVNPTIQFSMNGNTSYAKDRATIVTSSDDQSGILDSSLKYFWNTSTIEPNKDDFMSTFKNGGTIATPGDLTGGYYLWVLATDNAANTVITRSEVFNLDNEGPIISDLTISISNTTSSSFIINRSGEAVDNHSGLNEYPYIYQISLDDNNWTTKCQTSANTCNINGLNEDTTYYYRVCAVDNLSQQNCTSNQSINTLFEDYSVTKKVNKPRIISGMTPVKWNGSTWVNTTSDDPDWYNYTATDKKWANAKTADGSMWVWIPRYAYQIAANYHTNTAGTINIKFLQGQTNIASDNTMVSTNPTYSGNSQTNYIIHPAFKFGSDNVTGIWVAKFEPSNDGSDNIQVLPNETSWRQITVNDAFNKCRSMETNSIYGWGTSGIDIDTHMMKNSEWGAVAYLSQSAYGKNSEVWYNPTRYYTTGCAGDRVASTDDTSVCYSYETVNGVNASTTGNIYGIYDMSGGAYERMAAYIDNGDSNLSAYASSLLSANSKYKDVYISGSVDMHSYHYEANSSKKGDAIYETSGDYIGYEAWYTASSQEGYSGAPIFERGGYFGSGNDPWDRSIVGLFSFNGSAGHDNERNSFRPVFMTGSGL